MKEILRACYLYTIWGDNSKFYIELLHSVESLLRFRLDSYDIFIVCWDGAWVSELRDSKFADKITIVSPKWQGSKSDSFTRKWRAVEIADYEQLVFLDTDTHIVSNINDLFVLLNDYPICISKDVQPFVWYQSPGLEKNYEVPSSFPIYNTGVFGMNKLLIGDFLDTYFYYHNSWKSNHCQKSFRVALWKSRIKFFDLPIEYNFRVTGVVSNVLEIKVIHSRISPKRAVEIKNRSDKYFGVKKVFIPKVNRFIMGPKSFIRCSTSNYRAMVKDYLTQ